MAGLRRVAVVGTTGSGKTTLARRLAGRLGCAHVELDALHWDPGWTPAAAELFRERVAQALRGDAWVTDGNYRSVRDLVWARADTVVWLDYSLPRILWRVTRRTLRRIVSREELWNGNRERLDAVLGRDSLPVWALRTYRRRRREYPALLASPEYAYLRVVRLRSPRAAEAWLGSVEAARDG